VSPGRLLDHLARLRDAGVTEAEVSRRTGVSPTTLWRARRPGVRVSRIVERVVLAVEP
jgi:lambda repressor-like predicted transcriptional regulator